MARYKCKHCDRTFSDYRALGGHTKTHLAIHPLHPETIQHQVGDRTDPSASSSSPSSSGEEQELREEKSLGYGLRKNPEKSLRFPDPEFFVAADSGTVVQDKESESESRNLTRRRSKRNRKVVTITNTSPSVVESRTEPEQVSSVPETTPEEEAAATLVMMLSRKRKNVEQKSVELLEESEETELSKKKILGKHRCEKCKKAFRSSHTLDEHKRLCCEAKKAGKVANDSKIFECPFCHKMFASGQALGGHKRIHSPAAASSSSNTAAAANYTKSDNNLIDLNLPAPMEDDEFSVVSDAEGAIE